MKWFTCSAIIILLTLVNNCYGQTESDPPYAPDSLFLHGIYIDNIGEIPWDISFDSLYNQYKNKGVYKVKTRGRFYYLKIDSVTIFKNIAVSINFLGWQKFSLRKKNPNSSQLQTIEILYNANDFERLKSILDYYAKALNTYYQGHYPNTYNINRSMLLFVKAHNKPAYSLYITKRRE